VSEYDVERFLMKVGPNANFPIAVRHHSTEVDPETAHLYVNVFDVSLNVTVQVVFVPDVSHVAPPWEASMLPPDLDAIASVPQARVASVLLNTYVVTPNAKLAGTEERLPAIGGDAESSGVVFYITREEFDRYRTDLAALSEATGATFIGGKVNDLREHEVITFIERRILDSAWLRSRDAVLLGRPTSPAEA
jgi:hypothetical protein